VHGEMRLGQEDDAGDAARRSRRWRCRDEAMEEFADGSQPGAFDRTEASLSKRIGFGHHRPTCSAAAQVGGEMEALHGADYPAL